MIAPTYLILHDIRSVLNVGSIFRTADAAGVSKIYLSGYTPTPLDRFGRVRNDLHKAALGAEHSVAWEAAKDVVVLMERLSAEGVSLVAVEQDARSKPYTSHRSSVPTAFILGNEPNGLPQAVLDHVDAILEIPMSGTKESLNVAVAAGIILFHHRDRSQ